MCKLVQTAKDTARLQKIQQMPTGYTQLFLLLFSYFNWVNGLILSTYGWQRLIHSVLFGVILFSCIVMRASAFLLRAVNCLACVDCLRRGVGSLRLQPCSEVAVRLTSLMLFHSLYVAWSFAADSTNKFNKAFIRSHHTDNIDRYELQVAGTYKWDFVWLLRQKSKMV